MEGLGIDIKSFIIQLVNVGLFYFLFSHFLLKPILRVLDERKKRIQEGLENTEKAKNELAEIEKTKLDMRKAMKEENQKAIEEAKKDAKNEAEKIITEAKTQAELILKNAKNNAKQIEAQVREEIEQSQYEVIAELTKKILGDKLDSFEIKAKYQKAINEIKA